MYDESRESSDVMMDISDINTNVVNENILLSEMIEYPNDLSWFDYLFFEYPSGVVDSLKLARTLFDLREYRKCSHVLKRYANERNQAALFLYILSNYLISEQMTEEEKLQNGENATWSVLINKELI